ncbi:thioesterase II family protein [Streptomyces sp. NPDC091279]|uniref:thioesterase II family protein n=1 Tax=unclassified Streptomyces TaxID=2593676 RepID=UPI00380B88B6
MDANSLEPGHWIRRYHPAPDSGARLLCLPHAGGSAGFFLPVARALSSVADVLAVQYPGRQDRRTEPCASSVTELADRLLPVLLDGWTDRPLALFGHSMGASVAFELAGLLERAGTPPAVLIASGRRAPSRLSPEYVHTLGDEALVAELKQLSGTDARILGDDEMLRMVLPALRADYRAAETYQPERFHRVSCPVVTLTGDADPKVPLDDAEAWREHTNGTFEMHVFPGGHFYLADRAPDVITRIRTILARTALPTG